jgi:hypothetical protein
VVLLLVWRRPVLDAADAEAIAGAPVHGTVSLPPTAAGVPGLPRLAYRVVSPGYDVVMLVGPAGSRRHRRELVAALTEAQPGGEERIIADPGLAEVAGRAPTSLLLVVLRIGAPEADLREYVERYLDDRPSGVVLVRSSRWRSLLRRRT